MRLCWSSVHQSSSGEPIARPATAPMTIQNRTLPNRAPRATPTPAPRATQALARRWLDDVGCRSPAKSTASLSCLPLAAVPHPNRRREGCRLAMDFHARGAGATRRTQPSDRSRRRSTSAVCGDEGRRLLRPSSSDWTQCRAGAAMGRKRERHDQRTERGAEHQPGEAVMAATPHGDPGHEADRQPGDHHDGQGCGCRHVRSPPSLAARPPAVPTGSTAFPQGCRRQPVPERVGCGGPGSRSLPAVGKDSRITDR
jgi:hypothetical protein